MRRTLDVFHAASGIKTKTPGIFKCCFVHFINGRFRSKLSRMEKNEKKVQMALTGAAVHLLMEVLFAKVR